MQLGLDGLIKDDSQGLDLALRVHELLKLLQRDRRLDEVSLEVRGRDGR